MSQGTSTVRVQRTEYKLCKVLIEYEYKLRVQVQSMITRDLLISPDTSVSTKSRVQAQTYKHPSTEFDYRRFFCTAVSPKYNV